jgi:RNA-directed DNA polymerase
VHGTRDDVQTLREELTSVLARLGLRLSPAKTQIVHMSDSLDFLGFPHPVAPQASTSKRYVYTFIADRPIRSLKDKIRALTLWPRVIRWWMRLHRWKWKDVRRRLTGPNGRWTRPSADGIELFNIASVPVTRYRYRGIKIPNPWTLPDHV